MLIKVLQKLSIPEEENAVFLSPELSEWPSLLAQNNLVTNSLLDRSSSREELLRMARGHTVRIAGGDNKDDSTRKLVVTGHQAVWHHCGIWAKTLAASKLAKAVGGHALHIVLDHDICDTAMVLPKQRMTGEWSFEKVEIESMQKAVPLEFRPSVQRDRVRTFCDAVTKSQMGQFCKHVWLKYALDKKAQIPLLKNIAEVITYLQSMLNITLGLDNVMYLPVSELSESCAFADFASHVILDARSFAASYNSGIAKQIAGRNINPQETIRFLAIDEPKDWVGLPFWLLSPNGRRESLYVVPKKTGGTRFGTASAVLGSLDPRRTNGGGNQLRNTLDHLGYSLRPKAVSLTLFLRLFVADWFVHGVGGASYEAVTDYIIEDYYRTKPPRFGVATCNMTLPELKDVARLNCSGEASLLKQKLRNIKHSPEKYIDKSVLRTEPVMSLLREKRARITQARDHSLSSSIRRSAWKSLFEINERLSGYTKRTVEMLKNEAAQRERDAAAQEICDYREYFFGLFPEKALRRLAESFTFARPE
jgi:hypothetical protein